MENEEILRLEYRMVSKNPRQSVTLTRPLAAFLAAEAAELGISVSDFIRRILDDYRLKNQKG